MAADDEKTLPGSGNNRQVFLIYVVFREMIATFQGLKTFGRFSKLLSLVSEKHCRVLETAIRCSKWSCSGNKTIGTGRWDGIEKCTACKYICNRCGETLSWLPVAFGVSSSREVIEEQHAAQIEATMHKLRPLCTN